MCLFFLTNNMILRILIEVAEMSNSIIACCERALLKRLHLLTHVEEFPKASEWYRAEI